ncbi:MAG: hypothetical protein QW519_06015, partial [Candidatus Thermoplasmatota archaeon]
MFLAIAWLLVFIQYMIAIMILSTPFTKYSKGYAYELLDGVCLSTVFLTFFSSFTFLTTLLKNYLGADFLSWDTALFRIENVFNNLDLILIGIIVTSIIIAIGYIIASFLLTGLTLGTFSLFQADIACRIFQSIMLLSFGIGILSFIYKLFYIYAKFVYLFAPLIFCIGVVLYPPHYTRKIGILLIVISVIGYVVIPFLLGSIPMVEAKGIVENLGNSTYFDPFLYKNVSLSLVSKENRSLEYAIVFFNNSIVRWINCSERATLLPIGEYQPKIWYLGFIHNSIPENISINITIENLTIGNSSDISIAYKCIGYLYNISYNQFGNNTKIIFKLNNVSFVSPSFIVAYDNSFKGENGKYNATLKLDLKNIQKEEKEVKKEIYFYYDKNNIIDYSCNIIDPKIKVENYTIEVSHRIEDSSPEEIIEKGYVLEYKPRLEFNSEYLDHNETAIINTNIIVKKIILKYKVKPNIKHEERDAGEDSETFSRSNGKEQYHTFQRFASEGWSIRIDKIECSGPAYETHGYASRGSVARVRVTVHFTTDDPNATATITVKYKEYREIYPSNLPPEFANFLINFETIDRGFNAPDITYQQKDPILKPYTNFVFSINPIIPLIFDFFIPLLNEAGKVGIAMALTLLASDIVSRKVGGGSILTPFKRYVKRMIDLKDSKVIEEMRKRIEKKAWKDTLLIQGKAWERKEEERERVINNIEKEAEKKYQKEGYYFIEKNGEAIPVSKGDLVMQYGFYDDETGMLYEFGNKETLAPPSEHSQTLEEEKEDIDFKEEAKKIGLKDDEIEEIKKEIDSEYEDENDSSDETFGYKTDYIDEHD